MTITEKVPMDKQRMESPDIMFMDGTEIPFEG